MSKSSLRSLPGDRPESRWDFRAAFDRAPVATFLFDDASRACLEANKAAEILTAFSRGELLDRRIEDLHPRERRDRALKYFQKVRREPGFTYDDLNLETKDGRVVPVEVRGMSLGFDERKIILVYIRDITEERLLQREVLFQNHKLTTLNALSSAIRNSMELPQILSGSLRVIMEASGAVYGEVLGAARSGVLTPCRDPRDRYRCPLRWRRVRRDPARHRLPGGQTARRTHASARYSNDVPQRGRHPTQRPSPCSLADERMYRDKEENQLRAGSSPEDS